MRTKSCPADGASPQPRAALCEFLLARRAWERKRVPLFKPQIALDIILYCTLQAERSAPACTKDFHLAIGSSQDRVRQVLNQLSRDGWISSTADRHDARIRRILPTARALAVIDDYGTLLLSAKDAHSHQDGFVSMQSDTEF